MKLAGYIEESIVDGPGIRLVFFFQGCSHRCQGCHNPETWSADGGKDFTIEKIDQILSEHPYVDGITLSGGDPLDQEEACLAVLKLAKKKYSFHTIIFTGYLFDELVEKKKNDRILEEVLSLTDVIIDGPFLLDKRDISLRFRGSSNQRIIDVPASLTKNEIVILDW